MCERTNYQEWDLSGIEECKSHQLPKPIFEEIGTHFRVTISRTTQENFPLDSINKKIIDLLKDHTKLSNKEIAKNLGLSQRGVRVRLRYLVVENYIKAIGVGPYDPNKKYALSGREEKAS